MLPSLSLAAKLPGQLGDLATLCPAVCELWQSVQVRNSEVVGKWGREKEEGGRVAGPVAPGKGGCGGFLGVSLIKVSQKTKLPKGAHSSSSTNNLPGTREISILHSYQHWVKLKCALLKMVWFPQKPVHSQHGMCKIEPEVNHQKCKVLSWSWVSSSMKSLLLEGFGGLFVNPVVTTLCSPGSQQREQLFTPVQQMPGEDWLLWHKQHKCWWFYPWVLHSRHVEDCYQWQVQNEYRKNIHFLKSNQEQKSEFGKIGDHQNDSKRDEWGGITGDHGLRLQNKICILEFSAN